MRLGALIPTLALGAALVAPALAEADDHHSSERGRSGYHRSERGHGERYAPPGRYDGGHHRRGYHHDGHGYHKPHRYYGPRYRPYGRPYYGRPYYYGPRYYAPRTYYYRPAPPPPVYYAPRPVPYGYYGGPAWGPPPRRGVHGSVSVGLPFLGFSLYF